MSGAQEGRSAWTRAQAKLNLRLHVLAREASENGMQRYVVIKRIQPAHGADPTLLLAPLENTRHDV